MTQSLLLSKIAYSLLQTNYFNLLSLMIKCLGLIQHPILLIYSFMHLVITLCTAIMQFLSPSNSLSKIPSLALNVLFAKGKKLKESHLK